MDLLSRMRSIGKPVFECQRCARCCCHYGVPLFVPDFANLNSRVNISKLRGVVKVYLTPGEEPPKGIRFFLDAGEADRPIGEGVRCPFLDDENGCRIYEQRPIACQVFPLGQKTDGSACPHWNGRADDQMRQAMARWREEEKKVSKLGAENYYKRWLNLLYPKGYIPPSAMRRGVLWSPRSGLRM